MTNGKRFEQWYATNAFDYVSNPIGSRDCGLQRKAWQAAERDMLERCVAAVQPQPDGSYRAELITAGLIQKLKELAK